MCSPRAGKHARKSASHDLAPSLSPSEEKAWLLLQAKIDSATDNLMPKADMKKVRWKDHSDGTNAYDIQCSSLRRCHRRKISSGEGRAFRNPKLHGILYGKGKEKEDKALGNPSSQFHGILYGEGKEKYHFSNELGNSFDQFVAMEGPQTPVLDPDLQTPLDEKYSSPKMGGRMKNSLSMNDMQILKSRLSPGCLEETEGAMLRNVKSEGDLQHPRLLNACYMFPSHNDSYTLRNVCVQGRCHKEPVAPKAMLYSRKGFDPQDTRRIKSKSSTILYPDTVSDPASVAEDLDASVVNCSLKGFGAFCSRLSSTCFGATEKNMQDLASSGDLYQPFEFEKALSKEEELRLEEKERLVAILEEIF
jgi:hypothetical protein